MKKLVTLFTILASLFSFSIFPLSALASKARMTALQNAAHLSDNTGIFQTPATAANLGGWATFEFGSTSSTTAAATQPNAEAGFARVQDHTVYGFYMGHENSWVNASRYQAGVGYLAEENPLYLFYASKGETTWGAGLSYSNSDKKANGKQSATGVNLSAEIGSGNVYATLGLTNTATSKATTPVTNDKFTGSMATILGGGYQMDSLYFYGEFGQMGGKEENSNGSELSKTSTSNITFGVINSIKIEGGEFFYGVNYETATQKDDKANTKTETTRMPVLMGLEADATSWLVLRGSVKQNVLLGSTITNGGDAVTPDNSTTVGAGASIKWGKMTMDGTLEGGNGDSATGKINGSSLLALASFTYKW